MANLAHNHSDVSNLACIKYQPRPRQSSRSAFMDNIESFGKLSIKPMPPETFPRFTELPKELQIQIFTYAAGGAERTLAPVTTLQLYSLSPRPAFHSMLVGAEGEKGKTVWVAQSDLHWFRALQMIMMSCMLGRETTLMWWRGRMEGLVAEGYKDAALRKRVVEVLGEMIEQTRRMRRLDQP